MLATGLLAAPLAESQRGAQRPPAQQRPPQQRPPQQRPPQQRPPQPRQPTPTFRSTTQYVAVDVIVTDTQDRIVRDLTKDDFVVTEGGVAQTIDDFSFVEVPLASRTIDVSVPPPPPADVGSNAGHPRASRAMAFVIDDIGLKPQDLIPLRRTMVKFLETMSPDDQVAMTYIAHSNLSQDFTNDIGRLIAAVQNQKEALGTASPTAQRDKMSVLRNALISLSSARQPRRAIVLVSPFGCLPYPGDSMAASECRDLIQRAQRAGVPIYTIDPRLFTDENFIGGIQEGAPVTAAGESGRTVFSPAIESMRILATETGARGFAGMGDVPRAVNEIMIENGSYYLLGFYPKPLVNDGRFHEIDVKVKRPGLSVRARKGYNSDPASPKETTPKREMTASLGAGLDDPSLPVRAFVAPMAAVMGGKTRAVVTVELAYPLPEGGATTLNDELRVGILALTPDAKIKASFQREYQFTGTWKPTARGTFVINEVIDLPTEPLTVRVGVSSTALGKSGTTHVEVDVLDYRDSDVQLTPLILGTSQYALDAAVGLDTIRTLVPFQPATARTFSNTDTLRVFARVFWRTKHPNTDVRVSVQGPTPVPPQTTSIDGLRAPTGHTQGRFNTTLPLRGLTPGSYVLRVEAVHPDSKSFVREVPFEVR